MANANNDIIAQLREKAFSSLVFMRNNDLEIIVELSVFYLVVKYILYCYKFNVNICVFMS